MFDQSSLERSQNTSNFLRTGTQSHQALIPMDHRKYRSDLVNEHLKDYTFQPKPNEMSTQYAKARFEKLVNMRNTSASAKFQDQANPS